MTPEARIAELEAMNTRQREQTAALVARVRELEARLATGSRDSGKPPAIDGVGRITKSLRKQGHALLAALDTLFTGQPLYPALA